MRCTHEVTEELTHCCYTENGLCVPMETGHILADSMEVYQLGAFQVAIVIFFEMIM